MDSSAGEAATLFGAADPATDLFAATLGNDGSETATGPASSGEAQPHVQASDAASDLFKSEPDSADFFNASTMSSTTTEPSNAYNSWDDTVHQPTTAYNSYAPAPTSATSNGSYAQQYAPRSWYGGQAEASADQQTQTTIAYGAYQPASSYSSHGSYAPPAAVTSMPHLNATHNTSERTYDPYKPSSQTVSHTYAQPASGTQFSPYDPYKPAQLSSMSPTASQASYPYAGVALSVRNTTTIPASRLPAPTTPSAASAALYRPKTSNAYDPPLPPLRQIRHPHARQPHSLTSPVRQSLHLGEPSQSPPRRAAPPKHEQHSPVTGMQNGHAQQRYVSPPSEYVNYGREVGSDGNYTQRPSDNADASSGYGYGPSDAVESPYRGVEWTQTSGPTTSSQTSNAVMTLPLPTIGGQPESLSQFHYVNQTRMQAEPNTSSPQLVPGNDLYATSVNADTGRSTSNAYMDDNLEGGHARQPPRERAASSAVPVNGFPERTKSPGSASAHSSLNSPEQSFGQTRIGSPSMPSHLPPISNAYQSGSASPDGTRWSTSAERAASPASVSSITGSLKGGYGPYVPVKNNRDRSMSNGSVLSSISAVLDDPYAPVRHSRSSLNEQTSRGSLSGPYAAPSLNGMHTLPRAVPQDLSASQVLNAPAQIMGIYAPSPSLLGLNDPLGRTSVRVPVVSFGFGGKLVTCFHGMSSDVGFDVALSSRQSTDIKIHKLHKVIPESALDTSAASYPGPLFSDPGTPTTSLVRAGAATQAKTKKARVIKYLEERSEEIGRSLGYFHQGSLEARRAEAKHILVKLLKVMVENDGHLSGSPHIDTAVRAALVPRLVVSSPNPSLKTASSLSLSRPVDFQPQSPNIAPMYPEIASPAQGMTESPMAIHTLKPSNLDKIQEYLLRGDRRAACHYASDEKLWAHAMVIASSIDKEMWKEVVTEFVRTELASTDSRSVTQTSIPGEKARLSDGRESLRVAYSLFSGRGPASIQELLPPKPLMQSAQTLQLPPSSVSSLTPISASFSAPVEPMNIPGEILVRWPETSAMMFASPLTLETSSALTALGDQLAVNHWYEAAHACYLLSPQTSPIGGVGSSSRVVLIGAENPATSSMFVKDPDPIILSEIVEFAMSLAAPTKGQDAFVGLPHLQPYRLIRATSLAEMGHIRLANRYCEAITTCLNRTSPYMNPTFIAQLKGLSDRLTAAPQLDKTASWIGSKVSKPSLDSIGNWLEGRLTKFIAGDGDSPHAEDHAHAGHQQPFSGPFAHYSTITSANSSAVPSPQQSRVDLNEMPNSPPALPPFRTGSAMAYRPSAASYVPMNRASSAMDYIRPSFQRKPSPIPRVSSANATASPYADGSLYSQALNGYAFGSSVKQDTDHLKAGEQRTGHTAENGGSTGAETATWWGVSESDAPTPTASSFSQVHENEASMSSSGFISLMDDPAYSTMTSVSQTSTAYSRHEPTVAEEDEDDLGLGNSSTRAKRPPSDADEKSNTPRQTEEPKEETNPTQDTEKPEPKPASSGSWLSRLWRRDSAPAPIKANLGEQTTFYYDKELKRWVNKNTGPEAANPAPPPPPPRAQTASPGRSHASLPAGVNPPLPPARPATANAVGFGNGPPRPPMRVRSNLVPVETESGSAPPTPASATMPTTPGVGPPPGGRSRAQAKRPVRNRYVDVFQQQATSS